MNLLIERILEGVGTFFLLYLIGYATFLFASVIGGATYLYKRRRMYLLKNELKHQYYFPVSAWRRNCLYLKRADEFS